MKPHAASLSLLVYGLTLVANVPPQPSLGADKAGSDPAGYLAQAEPAYLLNLRFDDDSDLLKAPASADSNTRAAIKDRAIRITLSKSDAVPYRTERVPKPLPESAFDRPNRPRIGEEYWYGIKIFVPDRWIADNSYEVVTQWHAVGDDPSFPPGPPISLRMDSADGAAGLGNSEERADRWLLVIKAGSGPNEPEKRIDLGLVKRDVGQWVDWVFRITWAPDDRGRLTVWRFNQRVFHYSGPTMYPDEYGPFWKFGIYKAAWRDEPSLTPRQAYRVRLFDNVRIAQGVSIEEF